MSSSRAVVFSSWPRRQICPGFHVSKAAAMVTTYLLSRYMCGQSSEKAQVNLAVEKRSTKVVHTISVDDIGPRAAFCRCWRSKKFPYCDGAHATHNAETGDNVGPLIIKRKPV